jgi:hypothetical protein
MDWDYGYLLAGLIVGISVVLIRGTSPGAIVGCNEYISRRRRRVVGQIGLILAALVLAITITHTITSSPPIFYDYRYH